MKPRERIGMPAILPAPAIGVAFWATTPRRKGLNHPVAGPRNRIGSVVDSLGTRTLRSIASNLKCEGVPEEWLIVLRSTESVLARRSGQPDARSNSLLEAIGRRATAGVQGVWSCPA